ncbi:hypothetical protein EBO34_01705 [Alteribacter keqinensis]|uniref:Uncharacterized protein n=1 Tax=Alteribacter keqinensis TaxID=2483800 RepID=A0A3M7TTU1_9BACI|nr:hypothetical protein EBO34_01705 [Alteribacter keqinensis]
MVEQYTLRFRGLAHYSVKKETIPFFMHYGVNKLEWASVFVKVVAFTDKGNKADVPETPVAVTSIYISNELRCCFEADSCEAYPEEGEAW